MAKNIENMEDEYHKKKLQLEQILVKDELTLEQKEILKIVAEFGYVAAFCQRTCDMNGSFYAASRYQDEYNNLIKKLEKK